jgi:hypothetical protein
MTETNQEITHWFIKVPILLTLLAIVVKVFFLLNTPWWVIFVPVMISTSVGIFLIIVLTLTTWLLSEKEL